MSQKTKKELEEQIKSLQEQLDQERARPLGHTVSHCHFDGTNKTKMAIAEAVKAGMEALQGLDGDSYGIYFGGDK